MSEAHPAQETGDKRLRSLHRKSELSMHSLTIAAQIVIALSIAFVWIYHFPNVVNELHEYHLSDLVRSTVGAAKISLATLLVAGIWHPNFVLIPGGWPTHWVPHACPRT
jgi:hypothetical protein